MPGDVLGWEDQVLGLTGVDLGDATPTYLVGADGRLLYANSAFRRIRTACPEVLGDLSIEDIELSIRALGRPLRQDQVVTFPERTECFVSERSVVHDEDGYPVAVLGRLLPVTETERLERALVVAEDRLDYLQRLLPDLVWECDETLRLTVVSDRAFDRLGYLPYELVGRKLSDLAWERGSWLEDLAAPGRRRPFGQRSVDLRKKNGEKRTFEFSAICIYDAASGIFEGFLGIARDVTDREKQFAALVKAVDDAESANRAKTEFLANMSHELRTPLNAIMGFAQIMQMETFGPIGQPKYREYAGDIVDSSQHLLNVINDILDIAKIEAGRVDLDECEVEMNELLMTVERLVRPSAVRSGVVLSVNAPQGLPLLWADERRLRQVLLNLVSNAVKFTPPGGRVDMSARLSGTGVEIKVHDTGIGMSPDEVVVAMAPFGQIDSGLGRQYHGTGLGLPLSKALTELHGGRFQLDSETGSGTTVTVWLPAARLLRR